MIMALFSQPSALTPWHLDPPSNQDGSERREK